MKRYVLLVCICVLALAAQGCTYVSKISAEDIESITVTGLETGGELYCSQEQIESFVKAYNSACFYTNDVGTTHPYRADVMFSGGTALVVWGGTQGFCTMYSEACGQRNIKSAKLYNWFYGLE